MKKTININLGGYALTIDDDAYKYLETYLGNIKRRFYNSEGRDEILSDIEARMGELLTTNMGSRAVIAIADVESVVDIMGKPEEYGDDIEDMGTAAGTGASAGGRRVIRTGRRLYRDEEDATVGGVCSGLAAYFGIEDPLWVRIAFVVLGFMSFGFWSVAYILLWALVPPAVNASDRLSMKGEAINVDNIAREVEQGFDRFGNKVSEFGESVKKKSGGTGNALVRFIARFVEVLGKIFGAVLRVFAKLFKGVGVLAGVALLIGLAMLWIASAWFGIFSHDFVGYFSPLSSGLTWLGFTNVLFLVGIPIIGLLILFSRILFKYRTPSAVSATLIVLWVVNFFCGASLGAKGASGFSSESGIEETNVLSTNNDILYVDLVDEDFGDNRKYKKRKMDIHSSNIHLMSDKLLFENNLDIEIVPDNGSEFVLEQIISSRGSNTDNAEMHARSISYEFREENGRLILPRHYAIPKGSKFRDQEIDLVLRVPIGKKIQLNKKGSRYVRNTDYNDGDTDQTVRRFPEKTFTMTAAGLSCDECPKWGHNDYKGYSSYRDFIIDGNLTVEIEKSKSSWVRVPDDIQNYLSKYSDNRELTLSVDEDMPLTTSKISIGARDIDEIKTKGKSKVILNGFDNYNTKIFSYDQSSVEAQIDCQRLEVFTQNSASVTLDGGGNRIEIESHDQSSIDASSFFARRAEVKASNQSSVKVYAKEWIEQDKSNESSVEVSGDAADNK